MARAPASRRFTSFAALVTIALAFAGITPARADDRRFALHLGEAAFWSGPPPGAPDCTNGTDPCWEYIIEALDGAWRLRIGIDHATVGDVFTADVYGPDGSHAGTFSPGTGLYSAELNVVGADAGEWLVRVTAQGVRDLRYRMRATLEPVPVPPAEVEVVPPNLQALPPYDLSFTLPITNGATGGPSQGIAVPGGAVSCHPEEIVEEGAVRCLRMAFGVRNTGLGPMQLSIGPGAAASDRVLYQRVRSSDESGEDRIAGIARYHKTHMHYHHHDAIALQLFRVLDPVLGTLERAGAEHRKGFAHREELLREWDRFYPTWSPFGFGLSSGWGDYYEWDRPGNYIEFGTNTDGLYVLRITADPVSGIRESNDRDNVSYSSVRVTGAEIELLESGRGTDPWDPCKIVMPFGAEPDVPGGPYPPRPAECPPDTT